MLRPIVTAELLMVTETFPKLIYSVILPKERGCTSMAFRESSLQNSSSLRIIWDNAD